MQPDPTRRAVRRSYAAMAGQLAIGVLAGPLFVVGFYQLSGRLWPSLGEWLPSGWGGLLSPIIAAAALAGLAHWRFPRFRALAWTACVAAAAFHLWFEFVVIASFAGSAV